MPIYTKTGDDGTTALFGGVRLSKDAPQVEAYGSIDEATSALGLILSQDIEPPDKRMLTLIQRRLYDCMGFLCGASKQTIKTLHKDTILLENSINLKEKQLPPIHRFILPQGTFISTLYHNARTTVRRSERRLVACINKTKLDENGFNRVLQYINRLSDYLFVLARWYTRDKGDVLT